MKRKSSSNKLPPKYFGIGEWYGEDITRMTTAQRQHLADEALSNKAKIRPCPNRPDRMCHKRGGVCSLSQYFKDDDGTIRTTGLVTTCPSRFFDGGEVFRWIGETMLGTSEPKVLNEIPFLQKFSHEQADPTVEDEEGDYIGRIDNILVHPETTKRLEWCALEMQAVYFSGMAMSHEFRDIKNHPESLRFPVQKRRPDFRSSGPKRLLPQLQTKIPELSRWGRRLAICVDEAFYAELVGIEEVKHLSNADLAWFIVRYESDGDRIRLKRGRCVFSKLDSTVKALTGGVPMPLETFEKQIIDKLAAS
jgi:hypothetical protein